MSRELSTEEKMVLTGHFPYLAQALTMACRKTLIWRKTNDGTPCNFLNIFYTAQEMDAKKTPEDTYYYMVSAEGAIGITPRYEYMVKWLFIPMEDGPEKDAALDKLKADYDQVEAEAEAAEAAEQAAAQAPAPAAEAPAPPKFCTHCGAPFPDDTARFCTNCGSPRF